MARLNLRSLLLACTVTILPTGGAFATLINRGGGMIYDTTLNITWLYLISDEPQQAHLVSYRGWKMGSPQEVNHDDEPSAISSWTFDG